MIYISPLAAISTSGFFLMSFSIISSVVLDVMKLHSVQHLLEPILEPLIRKVVSEFLYALFMIIG